MKRSADKRNRQAREANLRNHAAKSTFRTAIKKFDAAVEAGDKEAAKAALDLSAKLLDSAADKNIIHHNMADRKKSRMALKYNKMA